MCLAHTLAAIPLCRGSIQCSADGSFYTFLPLLQMYGFTDRVCNDISLLVEHNLCPLAQSTALPTNYTSVKYVIPHHTNHSCHQAQSSRQVFKRKDLPTHASTLLLHQFALACNFLYKPTHASLSSTYALLLHQFALACNFLYKPTHASLSSKYALLHHFCTCL